MATSKQFVLGKLILTYENGFIRYVKAANAEVIRMIYFALRDTQWKTIPVQIDNEQINYIAHRSLSISYQATNRADGKDIIRWSVTIAATDKEVTFSVDGLVLNPFVRNRVGICVLHPIEETIGRAATIIQPDQAHSSAEFPVYIKPHQPFLEIREMKWTLSNGVNAHLLFDGDIFETEDQRNWSDTSFKTYSTPLRIPFPVEIQKGEKVMQRVTLRVNDAPDVPLVSSEDTAISVDPNQTSPFPELGTWFNHQHTRPNETEVELIHQLPLKHLRIDVHLEQRNWLTMLRAGLEAAGLLGLSPMLALHFSKNVDDDWTRFQQESRGCDLKSVSRVWLFGLEHFVSNDRVLSLHVKVRTLISGVTIIGGSASHFVEMNRYPFNFNLVDEVGYSVTPQAHANDDRTIVENLAAQPHAVRSARRLSSGKPVVVSPVTLRGVNGDADVRQATLFNAGWTVGTLKHLGEEGVSAITLFESHGPKGFVNDQGSFPVFETLRRIGQFHPEKIVKSTSNLPLRVTSLVLKNGDKSLTVLVNHTPEAIRCQVSDSHHTLAGYGIIYIES